MQSDSSDLPTVGTEASALSPLKNTRMYHARHESMSDSEPYYDSDNPEARLKLRNSPTHRPFYRRLQHRKKEEMIHEKWLEKMKNPDYDLKERIKSECGADVTLGGSRVSYIYVVTDNESKIVGKFKMAFVYVRLLRKWYPSNGRCFLPPTVSFKKRFKEEIYDPTDKNVLGMVKRTCKAIDVFMKRMLCVSKLRDSILKDYPDITMNVDKRFKSMQIKFVGEEWPVDIPKATREDCMYVQLEWDKHGELDDIIYQYGYGNGGDFAKSKLVQKMFRDRFQDFFDSPLEVSFKRLMGSPVRTTSWSPESP
ncbi:uncharacterized protein LOC105696251 [Orussus abietinus]|uniref:uncharacterized protein LOC105696251 n=1 Tax=Orussus abietinus TaxID=222816 RepID=UPI0006250601|nr:uncharacterized protein LOC105696251 [Orussus abietinus]XP_012274014.1 uncharacterized protein LOC105696251 [Orussus abietinus]XP_012274017.1 uncharacterized protein LOC105696251 [Orussus abietinus]